MTEACLKDTTSDATNSVRSQRHIDTAQESLHRITGGLNRTPELHGDWEAPSTRQSTSLWYAEDEAKSDIEGTARNAQLTCQTPVDEIKDKFMDSKIHIPEREDIARRVHPAIDENVNENQIHQPEKEDIARSVHPAFQDPVNDKTLPVDSHVGDIPMKENARSEPTARNGYGATAGGGGTGSDQVRPAWGVVPPFARAEGACKNAAHPKGGRQRARQRGSTARQTGQVGTTSSSVVPSCSRSALCSLPPSFARCPCSASCCYESLSLCAVRSVARDTAL